MIGSIQSIIDSIIEDDKQIDIARLDVLNKDITALKTIEKLLINIKEQKEKELDVLKDMLTNKESNASKLDDIHMLTPKVENEISDLKTKLIAKLDNQSKLKELEELVIKLRVQKEKELATLKDKLIDELDNENKEDELALIFLMPVELPTTSKCNCGTSTNQCSNCKNCK